MYCIKLRHTEQKTFEWKKILNKRPWGAPTDGRCYGNSRYGGYGNITISWRAVCLCCKNIIIIYIIYEIK